MTTLNYLFSCNVSLQIHVNQHPVRDVRVCFSVVLLAAERGGGGASGDEDAEQGHRSNALQVSRARQPRTPHSRRLLPQKDERLHRKQERNGYFLLKTSTFTKHFGSRTFLLM